MPGLHRASPALANRALDHRRASSYWSMLMAKNASEVSRENLEEYRDNVSMRTGFDSDAEGEVRKTVRGFDGATLPKFELSVA